MAVQIPTLLPLAELLPDGGEAGCDLVRGVLAILELRELAEGAELRLGHLPKAKPLRTAKRRQDCPYKVKEEGRGVLGSVGGAGLASPLGIALDDGLAVASSTSPSEGLDEEEDEEGLVGGVGEKGVADAGGPAHGEDDGRVPVHPQVHDPV